MDKRFSEFQNHPRQGGEAKNRWSCSPTNPTYSNLKSDFHMQQPQTSQQAVACNKDLKSNIRLSHATTSNLMTDCRMHQGPQISHLTVTCNNSLKSHIRLSQATTLNLTTDCRMQQGPQISHHTITCNKKIKSHTRLSHATRNSNPTSDCHMK